MLGTPAGTELLQRLKAHWEAAAQHDNRHSYAAAGEHTRGANGEAAAGQAAEGAHGHVPGPLPMFTSCCPAWINLVEKVGRRGRGRGAGKSSAGNSSHLPS